MSQNIRPLVGLLLACLVIPTTAVGFHEDDIPVVATYGGEGSGSYAMRLDHGGGDFAIDLIGFGPATAQSVSVAAFFFDANKNLVFGFAFTGHGSPDRMVLEPIGMTGSVDLIPEWLDVHAGAVSDAATDAPCPYACMGLTGRGAPAGTYYYLLFVAGVSENAMEIRSTGVTVATVNQGAAWSYTDADMTGGDVNVQAQQSLPAGGAAGVKAIQGAGAAIQVEDALYGFWGTSDFKLACQFAVGACVWRSMVTDTCYYGLGVSCTTTSTSWSGPNGAGGSEPFAAFLGAAAGDYAFTIDQKVELYGPNLYDATTGSWVFLGEEYTYFVGADNRLP